MKGSNHLCVLTACVCICHTGDRPYFNYSYLQRLTLSFKSLFPALTPPFTTVPFYIFLLFWAEPFLFIASDYSICTLTEFHHIFIKFFSLTLYPDLLRRRYLPQLKISTCLLCRSINTVVQYSPSIAAEYINAGWNSWQSQMVQPE